jgi:hypothetical protein
MVHMLGPSLAGWDGSASGGLWARLVLRWLDVAPGVVPVCYRVGIPSRVEAIAGVDLPCLVVHGPVSAPNGWRRPLRPGASELGLTGRIGQCLLSVTGRPNWSTLGSANVVDAPRPSGAAGAGSGP